MVDKGIRIRPSIDSDFRRWQSGSTLYLCVVWRKLSLFSDEVLGIGVIELKQISVRYGDAVVALQPTSVTFRQGEFTVLLGASGAGKSTLLRAINLLTPPSEGEVWIAGERVSHGPALRRHRRNTAMIFQQHHLIKRHSALRNTLAGRLGYYSSLRSFWPMGRQDRELALRCLDRVGLLDKALARADHLSGGQQQRVGIARALAQQPRILLADEPVASLDPSNAEQVMALLQRICREDGLTAIVSLHQLDLAKAFAQRIVALQGGRVVFDGAAAELDEAVVERIYRSPAAASPVTESREGCEQ